MLREFVVVGDDGDPAAHESWFVPVGLYDSGETEDVLVPGKTDQVKIGNRVPGRIEVHDSVVDIAPGAFFWVC